jgi:hypothetical protein
MSVYVVKRIRVADTGHELDDWEWTINGPGINARTSTYVLGRFPTQEKANSLRCALELAFEAGCREKAREIRAAL